MILQKLLKVLKILKFEETFYEQNVEGDLLALQGF